MTENVPEPQPAPQPRPSRPRWRDRAWSLPVVIAVALVAVILGGLGGAALASVGDHQDGRRGPGFHRFPGGGHRMPGPGGAGQPDFRFDDPYVPGPRQWGQPQQPGGPAGPLQRYGDGGTPTPSPPMPTP